MTAGFVCLLVALSAGAGVLALRAGASVTLSGTLGTAAAACGVAACVPAQLGLVLTDPVRPKVLAACGGLAALLAALATALSIAAFVVRRRDNGVRKRYPIGGLVGGAVNLVVGYALMMLPAGYVRPLDGTSWVWTAVDHGYQVTVPSDRWTVRPNSKSPAEFGRSRPLGVAVVTTPRPARTEDEYQSALAYGLRVRADTPTTNTDERSGTNPNGHPYWLYMGDATGRAGPYFFGVSVTRAGDKAVVLMFEAPYQLRTESGHAQEALAHRAQADLFLSSVR